MRSGRVRTIGPAAGLSAAGVLAMAGLGGCSPSPSATPAHTGSATSSPAQQSSGGPAPTAQDDGNAPAGVGYISLLWGRSNWQVATGPGCTTHYPGARTLADNAADLAARGMSATAMVVVSRTKDSGHPCFSNYTEQASWADLRALADTYGWSVTSQGMHYANMTQMTTDAQRYAESAATLPILAERGYPRAWGAFAFANNKRDAPAVALVSRYFGFLRKYGGGLNTRASSTTAPYTMNTLSINGGRCHNPALPCYLMKTAGDTRTTDRALITAALRPGPERWGVVQAYRLVEGAQGRIGEGTAWDCTSADWRDRWTSQAEIFCRNSYLEAIDTRDRAAIVTDPTTVAEAWGRSPADYLGWPRP